MKKIKLLLLMLSLVLISYSQQSTKLFKNIKGTYTFNEMYFLEYNDWMTSIYEEDNFGLKDYNKLSHYDKMEVRITKEKTFLIDGSDKYISIYVNDKLFYKSRMNHIELRYKDNDKVFDIISGSFVVTIDMTEDEPYLIIYYKHYYEDDAFKFETTYVFYKE